MTGLLSVTLLFAACGDDDADDAATTTTAIEETTTTTEAEPAALDPAEVTAAVSATIDGFFAALGEGRYDDAATLLENGEDHTAEFEGFATLAVGVTSEVKDVEILDDTTALYTTDISINGTVALADSSGEAVLIDGDWLMSEDSWNALAALVPPAE